MALIKGKQQRILAAAIELFTRWGYDKTSLDEIARAAHISKGSIYYYFSSKENLFIDAIRLKAEELFKALDTEIGSAANFGEKISCCLRLPMIYIFENMPILIVALHQIPSDYLENLEEIRAEYRSRMNATLAGVIDFGKSLGIINDWVDSQRFSDIINDWFMMGESWIDASDKDKIIQRIERDHDLIVKLLLYGIIKPGMEEQITAKVVRRKSK